MKRLKLILLLFIAGAVTAGLQAQVTTIKTIADSVGVENRLIISEVYKVNSFESTNYIELTNLADSAINLGNYRLACTGLYPGLFNEAGGNVKLPDFLLQPDSTYLIANQYYNFGELERYQAGSVTRTPYEGTQVDILKKMDLAVYDSVFQIQYPGPADTIIPAIENRVLNRGSANGGFALALQVTPDSLIGIDQIRFAKQDKNDDYTHAVAGIPLAWPGHVFVRRTGVTKGNMDWDDQRGNSPEDSEWLVLPFRNVDSKDGGVFAPFFTTIGHHGVQTLDNTTVSSNLTIDWDNKKITVPWGVDTDYIMENFDVEDGITWHYNLNMEMEDLSHNIAVTGDTLTLYAVGDIIEQVDFAIEQTAPSDDMNVVFPLNNVNYNSEEDTYSWSTPYYVTPLPYERYTQNLPEMDSIGNVGFATRVDSLFKYLDKPSNAEWEIVWLGGEERVDLKRGDILKVTAENGATKEYFIAVDSVPPAGSNALLSSITWPDAPAHVLANPVWANGDTIPGFSENSLIYTIDLPYGTSNVPALIAKTDDLNAKIDIERAAAVKGPIENRTTTITVTAEDDSTKKVYNVIFNIDKPSEFTQPFSAHPFISRIAYKHRATNNFLQITNPGNQVLDMSNYMIGVGTPGMTPADVIQRSLSFEGRYYNYIPGYAYNQTVEEWQADSGIIKKDLEVDPNIEGGGVFVLRSMDNREDRNQGFPDCNVVFATRITVEELEGELMDNFGYIPEGPKVFYDVPQHLMLDIQSGISIYGSPVILFKITNDSIKAGLKAVGDPKDFKVIDVFGDYQGSEWSPGADTLVDIRNKSWNIQRKSEYWQNDTLPGILGSWAETDEESEWVSINPDKIPDLSIDFLAEGIGKHFLDPITTYVSTVSSFVYGVSDGYTTPQTIRGVPNGTIVSDLFAGLDKGHEDQYLKVMGKGDTDAIADQDTLIVTSADSTNVTKYAITLGAFSSDAVLTSSEYTIEIGTGDAAGTGTVTEFDYGTLLSTFIDNISVPAGATMSIVDENDALIPFIKLNFDTIRVPSTVNSMTYLDVVAEDGVTRIIYQLQPNGTADDAFILSDVYMVSQELNIVSLVPGGTNAETLLSNLIPAEGATVKLVNKIGNERTEGVIKIDDKIFVTSSNGEVTRVYYLSLLNTQTSLAYALSDVYTVDGVNFTIEGPTDRTEVSEFLSNITLAPGATAVVVDADGNERSSGNLVEGDKLKVTSGDGEIEVIYELQVDPSSVNNLDAKQISIYPNPASGDIFVEGMKESGELIFLDISGSTVKMVNTNIHDTRVSLQDLTSGIYFIYLQTDNYRSNVVKIVKQ